jgi:tRNA1Val (adenine37-N6)-methyltransferase
MQSTEQSIALAGDFRVIQNLRGHRYSVDDMVVAHLACTWRGVTSPPARVLDLGCGLGSVLLITAWAFRGARLVGLELLPEHVDFARRNVRLNQCDERVRIVAGDLRDEALVSSLGRFDLVTGSPPYFALGSGTLCQDPSRAAAHFELNGGIEDYAMAARRALAPDGLFVTCANADPPERVTEAFERAGLHVHFRQDVVPRPGKSPFLTLLVGSGHAGPATLEEVAPLVLRRADGRRTPEHVAIREWTAISPRSDPPGSPVPGAE